MDVWSGMEWKWNDPRCQSVCVRVWGFSGASKSNLDSLGDRPQRSAQNRSVVASMTFN